MSLHPSPPALTWLRALYASLDRSDTARAPARVDERAAVAIIIRSQPAWPLELIHSSQPAPPTPTPATLQVLFMKRALREGDPWSGHVSFPGGRVEASDASLLHTAIRETQEEVGLDLTPESGRYVFWGRGRNAQVRTRTPFQVGTFVFYELAPAEGTPGDNEWRFSPQEVSSVRWQSLWCVVAALRPPEVVSRDVPWPFRAWFMSQRGWLRWIWSWWQPRHLYFPGVVLPPTHEAGDCADDEYHLWGMTYHVLHDLLREASSQGEPGTLPAVPSPLPFRFRQPCLDWLMGTLYSFRARL